MSTEVYNFIKGLNEYDELCPYPSKEQLDTVLATINLNGCSKSQKRLSNKVVWIAGNLAINRKQDEYNKFRASRADRKKSLLSLQSKVNELEKELYESVVVENDLIDNLMYFQYEQGEEDCTSEELRKKIVHDVAGAAQMLGNISDLCDLANRPAKHHHRKAPFFNEFVLLLAKTYTQLTHEPFKLYDAITNIPVTASECFVFVAVEILNGLEANKNITKIKDKQIKTACRNAKKVIGGNIDVPLFSPNVYESEKEYFL